ncbi:hypothetical protein PIROE2DRAFT_5384, partial [Piromyces sp. E2]
KPYHCELICGNINLPLQIYPTPREPLFPKVFSIIGFLTESDAPLPAYKSRYLLLPYEKQKNPLNTYQVIQKSLINKNVYAIVTFGDESYGYIHTANDTSYMSLSIIPTLEQEVEEISKYDKSFKIPIFQSETSYFKADMNLIPRIIKCIPELPKNQDIVLKIYQGNPNIYNSLNTIISNIEYDLTNGNDFKTKSDLSSPLYNKNNDVQNSTANMDYVIY